ncbi:hypothetical protein ACFFMN_11990 [Planobispora siamensis]|uniref:Uncharacterized protein n=1 Tax=Planobispora siamensis TaxID=936338 RepID=A0A8J3WHU6_9ACTN|nr:hypothetical protein [Planobispora siamensis]GIH89928.1 hypothetical protein Psi01_05580 [Planobispora siamensis]
MAGLAAAALPLTGAGGLAMPDSLLSALIGQELGSVVFVRDYLQLDFDGPRLTLFVWPQVSVDSTVHSMGDPGYRDTLCALIGHTVLTTAESPDAGLVVGFGRGSVTLKPEPSHLEGLEIAMLGGFTDREDWMVWRPDEYPFDAPKRPLHLYPARSPAFPDQR